MWGGSLTQYPWMRESLSNPISIVSAMPNESRVSRGYLTVVPKAIRAATGVAAGDRLTWTIEGDRIVVVPRRVKSLGDIQGLISHGGDAVRAKRRVQRGQL